jgi:hypothetical protein
VLEKRFLNRQKTAQKSVSVSVPTKPTSVEGSSHVASLQDKRTSFQVFPGFVPSLSR